MENTRFAENECRYTKGKLVRIRHKDFDIKITSEEITVKGYSAWVAVTYMRANENRLRCAEWVLQLIERGILKKEDT